MHKNILSFWQHLENLTAGHPDKLSPRVCLLLQDTFERWNSKPRWPAFDRMGHLADHVPDPIRLKSLSVAERKGLAIKKMFEILCDPDERERAGTMTINPIELIVGTLPPYSVGQGKELMRYLSPEESLFWELRYYNEWSPFGHIVPDYEKLLREGIMGMIRTCHDSQGVLSEKSGKKYKFYQSVIDALSGVLYFINAYADMAAGMAITYHPDDDRYRNLQAISARLRKCPAQPAETFMDALQSIYIMHCALHFTGEIVPLGRLDQLLYPYYQSDLSKGIITAGQAQEALDCFWIKLDEKVILNRRFVEDRFSSSDGALLGAGGPSNFDQGALINQWMQQITIGGIKANNSEQAEEATNELTYMCLESARRLPLNSPTLDLRVHAGTDEKLLEAAARTILSGGAHPILMNDDKIIPALLNKTGGTVELRSARNYACDGCYETLFAGETEFSFGFVGALDVLEKALNSGAGFAASGSTYLRGSKGSYRTPPAAAVIHFEEFWSILNRHILLGCHKFLHGILTAYGSKEEVSPSPLLSALIHGCMEKGRDLAGGGARYHLFSPLMTGISTAADSLYVIKKLVFTDHLFTLPELVACLRSNWGRTSEIIGLKLSDARIREIRAFCMAQPKFGQGVQAVDELAWQLIGDFYNVLQEARKDPVHKADWERLVTAYSEQEAPFEILLAPGVGTFEQFNFSGAFAGATADGRYASDPISSDLSPAPLHSDEPPVSAAVIQFMDGLSSYMANSVELLSDGGPPDFNIREDFSEKDLTEILKRFAKGHGGNMLTVTVANPDTFREAQQNPESNNLVRVRMGGWTEFFISLFPPLQEQHKRRPLFS